jgi:hypothetical protein
MDMGVRRFVSLSLKLQLDQVEDDPGLFSAERFRGAATGEQVKAGVGHIRPPEDTPMTPTRR